MNTVITTNDTLPATARVEEAVAASAANTLALTAPGPDATARERLAWSREQMRQTMWARAHPQRRGARSGSGSASDSPWLDRLKSLPGVGVVIDTLGEWWNKHPLAPVAEVAGDAARSLVGPVAQRHPIGLLVVAALAGALLMKSRPRRWLFTRAWFAGLVPLLAIRLIDKLPFESWIGMLAGLGTQTTATASTASASPVPSASQAPRAAGP